MKERRIGYFLAEQRGTVDYHLTMNGIIAAKSMLPNFEWGKIRSQWSDLDPNLRTAALVLRRETLKQRFSLPSNTMPQELLGMVFDDGELRLLPGGIVRIVDSTDEWVWNNLRNRIPSEN